MFALLLTLAIWKRNKLINVNKRRLYLGGLVTDIQNDLATGIVIAMPEEKRVNLEEETAKLIKKIVKPGLICAIFVDCWFTNYFQKCRNRLMRQEYV